MHFSHWLFDIFLLAQILCENGDCLSKITRADPSLPPVPIASARAAFPRAATQSHELTLDSFVEAHASA